MANSLMVHPLPTNGKVTVNGEIVHYLLDEGRTYVTDSGSGPFALPPEPAVKAPHLSITEEDWLAADEIRESDGSSPVSLRYRAAAFSCRDRQLVEVLKREDATRKALAALLADWVQVGESGDAGNWDIDNNKLVIAARAALAMEIK